MPTDKFVVLGLVSSKRPRLETVDDLVSRIRQAGRFFPPERLALSPQCGFATSILGNRLSQRDQQQKLERLVETANLVWG